MDAAEQINTNIEDALGASQENIEIAANMYQYSWVFILGLTFLLMFIYTRALVEVGGGGMI